MSLLLGVSKLVLLMGSYLSIDMHELSLRVRTWGHRWLICDSAEKCTVVGRPHLGVTGRTHKINLMQRFCRKSIGHNAGCRRLSKVERMLRLI
jgi:hypothetical protein